MEFVWLAVAFLAGLCARGAGLPPLVGYLGAGFALQTWGLPGSEGLEGIAHLGVQLLLFTVGLEVNLRGLARADVIGGTLLQQAIVLAVGAPLLIWSTGIAPTPAVLVTACLGFSSTVFAAKVLAEKRELRAFHGRLAVGVLIVQDLMAVLLLSLGAGQAPSPWALLLLGLPLVRRGFWFLLDRSGHDELLVLFGLVAAVVLGGLGFQWLGLSAELGALVLGALVAGHARAHELATSLWSIKETLLVGFFLGVGLTGLPTPATLGWAALLVALLPLKLAIFMGVLLAFRLRARTAFLASLALATYSEFGLVVVSLAVDQGMLPPEWLVRIAIAVALSLMVAAPLNHAAHALYERLAPWLLPLETRVRHQDDAPITLGSRRVLVVGMGRLGTGAYDFLETHGERVVGLDSDLVKVERHLHQGRRVIYGDAEDPGLWHNLHLEPLRAVLLAVPDPEAVRIAARHLRARGYAGFLGATSLHGENAATLAGIGVDFVLDYHHQIGLGFGEVAFEHLHPEAAATLAREERASARA